MSAFSEAPTLGPSTAIGRWVGLGPYYAMFPSSFAFDVVNEYCATGGAVLDPFAGRASSIFAAATCGRTGIGIEINPVGWLYGRVKLAPATKCDVLDRIRVIANAAHQVGQDLVEALPEFFTHCYTPSVLRFLLAARAGLQWQSNAVDASLMAILLVNLHGKRSQSLSNQWRQGKSMSPGYSVRWWKEKKLSPPDIDPVDFLVARVEWRYAKGIPCLHDAQVLLGDSTSLLLELDRDLYLGQRTKFDLLFTSPPYFAVTNYNYDQWLRLWMLGGPSLPIKSSGLWQGRFEAKTAYQSLIKDVFRACSALLADDANVYVRTDARKFTLDTNVTALREIFPSHDMRIIPRPLTRQTQTALFGDKSNKPGEMDIVLRR